MKKVSLLLWVVVFTVFLVGCTQPVAPTDDTTADIAENSGTVEQPTQALPEELQGTVEKSINTETSVLNREARKVTGKHRGRVFLKTGRVMFVDGTPTEGAFTIDMMSFTVDDDNEAVYNHLRWDDFFSVETYPESTLVITNVQTTDVAHEYLLTADLTIKGITNPITFVAVFTADRSRGTASFQIDRTLRDIKFRSTKFFDDLKNNAIDDMIDFDVTIDFE